MRFLFGLLLLLLVAAGAVFLYAGRLGAPAIHIQQPQQFVGLASPLTVAVDAPGAELDAVEIVLEQDGRQFPLFSLSDPQTAEVRQDGQDRMLISREIGRQSIPDLQSGDARLVVTAARDVVYGIRTLRATETRDVRVRLERPRVGVVSTHHYINHGGAEVVLYRVSPEDVESGVVVGEVEYPGYPAHGITVDGVSITDPALRVAFFALLHDQDLNTPIRLFARDEAGNMARADFDHRTFPRPFRRSTINLDDRFLDRIVPAILDGTREIAPEGDSLEKFLAINGELRRLNNEKIASFAGQTSSELLWRGVVFHPFTNTGVQSAFADHRTYMYRGREVDQQVHLGFDLASYTATPIVAANRGKVLFADELGIYGNTVIIDHGMGIQSLYAHLSSFDVREGDFVEKEQVLGRSGMTGLAGGDHLHFTMLVNGQMVNPVEWWDPKWIRDRILRKFNDAGGTPRAQALHEVEPAAAGAGL
jgi:murein DD-endopeptidase MepM/ murein hydrolase activator NlpD